MRRGLTFVLPFFLWVYLHRDFLSGAIPLNLDTNTIYGVTKYYFNNVLNGVMPLWDPFVSLGRPFYALSICNLFNPLTQLVAILKLLGLNYHQAFTIYLAVYFWFGCVGFYFLAKQILKDTRMAFLCYIALMFSSLGTGMFTQFTLVEILVPTLWFFYFVLAFAHGPKQGTFLGTILSIMMALSAYLPFYFLTVVCLCALGCVVLFPKEMLDMVKVRWRFKSTHWRLSLLCAAGVLIAAGPLLSYKILDASGDAVSPGRHCQYTTAQECYDRTMNQHGGMLYEEIARSGGLGERIDVGYLFAHLDKMTYGSDSLFFMPLWIYLLLLLSVFLKVDKTNVLLAGMATAIGLIALGDATPAHRFLYEHVFFFKYFRNLFFLGAFLIPLLILLAIKQLQALLAVRPSSTFAKKMIIVGIVLAHAAAIVFLRQYHAMPSAYATLLLSAGFFILHYSGALRVGMTPGMWTLALLLVLQPVSVVNAYSANAGEFKCVLPSAHVVPQWSWVRPDQPATSSCRIYQFVPYEDFWYAMSMRDAPAKVGIPQAAARWTFELSQRLGEERLAAYAKYKVHLYDRVPSSGEAVQGPSGQLDVAHFDVNRVIFKTQFDRRKLLVYNDSFTQSWRAKIDGQKQTVKRTNDAFKGVWVPAGEHRVEFYYAPPGGQWVYVLAAVMMLLFALLTAHRLYRRM